MEVCTMLCTPNLLVPTTVPGQSLRRAAAVTDLYVVRPLSQEASPVYGTANEGAVRRAPSCIPHKS
jgi:hypothetical protein